MAKYTKADLIKEIATKTGTKQREVRAMLDALCEITYREAKEDGGIAIPGICRIDVVKKKARKMRNPQTQQEILISEHDAARVRLLKKAKDAISSPRVVTPLMDDGETPDPVAAEEQQVPVEEQPREIIYDDFSVAVSFRCQECQHEIEAPAAAVGLTSECPVCGKPVKIPAESEPGTIHGPKIEVPTLDDMVEQVAQSASVDIDNPDAKNQTIRIDLSTLDMNLGGPTKQKQRIVSFFCKGCGQELEAPAEMMGMQSECPECGTGFEVPFFSEPGTLHGSDLDRNSSAAKDSSNLSGRTIRIEMPDF